MEEVQEGKEEKNNSLIFKALQDSSDEDDLQDSSEDNDEIASYIINLMEYLKRKNLSKHKEFKRGSSKQVKEIICFF